MVKKLHVVIPNLNLCLSVLSIPTYFPSNIIPLIRWHRKYNSLLLIAYHLPNTWLVNLDFYFKHSSRSPCSPWIFIENETEVHRGQ